ncbi:glycosyltransferase family 2 protein [Candidatus Omnitrophota bacterium]
MSKLSVVIATKNEEKNIRSCLESVKWADEIIVVDDKSADRTVEITREYTDNVILNDSKGVFHVNKNLGIERASGEWILSIDADERVPPELASEIKSLIEESDKLGYYVGRKNYFRGKWIRGCGWSPDYIIRLFRKGVTKWPLEVHDVPSIKDEDKVGYLKNPLTHKTVVSLKQYSDKFAQYTTKLAQEEYDKGTRITAANFLFLFVVKPVGWFVRKYFVMRGYVDGFSGLFISFSSGLVIFVTHAKLLKKQNKT